MSSMSNGELQKETNEKKKNEFVIFFIFTWHHSLFCGKKNLKFTNLVQLSQITLQHSSINKKLMVLQIVGLAQKISTKLFNERTSDNESNESGKTYPELKTWICVQVKKFFFLHQV